MPKSTANFYLKSSCSILCPSSLLLLYSSSFPIQLTNMHFLGYFVSSFALPQLLSLQWSHQNHPIYFFFKILFQSYWQQIGFIANLLTITPWCLYFLFLLLSPFPPPLPLPLLMLLPPSPSFLSSHSSSFPFFSSFFLLA